MRAVKITFAVAIGMALLLGCGSQDERATSSSKGRLFGVSFQTMNNPFFVDLNEGIEAPRAAFLDLFRYSPHRPETQHLWVAA